MANEKNNVSHRVRNALFGALLIALVCALIYIAVLTRETSRQFNRYSLLNPTVLVSDRYDPLVNFQWLRESLTSRYETRPDYLVSIYFEYLPTGSNINVNKDAKIWPASLIKVPVAMAVMKKIERGQWTPTNELVILDEDKDSEFGTLYQKPTGTTISIQDLLEETLARSDNTAHFVLLRNLDGSELEEVFTHLGLDDILTTLKRTPEGEEADNRMTAKNYSIFFRSLYNATFLSPEYSQMFLDILQRGPHEYNSLGLPEGLPFSHKTGIRTDDQVWADSGIVYLSRRPYLLTVMIQKKPGAPRDTVPPEELFKDISSEIYRYVANLQ